MENILLEEELRQQGVADKALIHINFELMKWSDIDDYKKLYQLVQKKLATNRMFILCYKNVNIIDFLLSEE